MENAKIGLHKVTLKNYHCSASVSNSASSSIKSEKSPGRVASDHQSSTSEEDEFEKELDLIERRRSSNVRNDANGELDKMKGALNKNIDKIIEIGRLRRNCLGCYQTIGRAASYYGTMERLFSSTKFILSDQRSSMTRELLETILFLRANAQQ